MPETTVAPPAVAAPSKPAPNQLVTPPTIPTSVNQPAKASAPAKKEESIFTKLDGLAKQTGTPPEPSKPAPAKPKEAPIEKPIEAEIPTEPETLETKEPTEEPAKPEEKTDPAKPKFQVFREYDKAKLRIKELEKQLTETKTAPLAEKEKTEYLTRIEKAEARAKELEDEIRFVDYSKSAEFKEKFHQPYEKAWTLAMADLKELTVPTPEGGQRAVTAQDLLELVNLPLGKARELADQVFGPFANDVMGHRKELRKLFESRAEALEDARKTGSERDKTQRELQVKSATEAQKFIAESWKAANESILASETYGQYLKPIEGDEEWNNRLARGEALVNAAFSSNPLDPKLNPEERAAVVKKQAAMRHRAVAFGAVVHRLKKEMAAHEETKARLKEFSDSEPPAAGGSSKPAAQKEEGGGIFATLDKLAK